MSPRLRQPCSQSEWTLLTPFLLASCSRSQPASGAESHPVYLFMGLEAYVASHRQEQPRHETSLTRRGKFPEQVTKCSEATTEGTGSQGPLTQRLSYWGLLREARASRTEPHLTTGTPESVL